MLDKVDNCLVCYYTYRESLVILAEVVDKKVRIINSKTFIKQSVEVVGNYLKECNKLFQSKIYINRCEPLQLVCNNRCTEIDIDEVELNNLNDLWDSLISQDRITALTSNFDVSQEIEDYGLRLMIKVLSPTLLTVNSRLRAVGTVVTFRKINSFNRKY